MADSPGLFTFVPFNPLNIAGCTLWLKADSLVLNNSDPVSTWTDSSGSGNDMSQATGGFQPLYKTSIINSLPSVLFDGVDDFMSKTGTFNIASFFIVTQPTLSTASQKAYACFFHTTGSIFLVAKLSTSFWGVFAGSDVSSTNALTSGSNYLLGNTFSAGSVKLYQRGSLLVTSGNTENSGPANTGLGKDLVNANRQYAGYISEIIAYDTVISSGNRILVENYLIARYAL